MNPVDLRPGTAAARPSAGTAGIALLVLAAACGGGPPSPQGPAAPVPLAPLTDTDRLYSDNGLSDLTDSARIVIQDPVALRDVWARATSRQPAPPPAPQIDFGQHMVVVVAAGRKSPQDRIRVDSVGIRRATDVEGGSVERLFIVVRTVEGCRPVDLDAYPVQIVRVPRFDPARVEFLERRERGPGCQTPEARREALHAHAGPPSAPIPPMRLPPSP